LLTNQLRFNKIRIINATKKTGHVSGAFPFNCEPHNPGVAKHSALLTNRSRPHFSLYQNLFSPSVWSI